MNWQEFYRTVTEKGFIAGPFPQIYGGFAGFYAYGPVGKLLKTNVIATLEKFFQAHGFDPVEAPLVNPFIVWKASGHVDRFFDPVVKCKKCGKAFRADKLVEEATGKAFAGSIEELERKIKELGIKCPSCGGELGRVFLKNLMLSTKVGIDGEDAFLRPETATTTYLLFPVLYHAYRRKMPIKVYQYGKAFRNEISPRKFILRMREFTQFEAQIFAVDEADAGLETDEWKAAKVRILTAEMQKAGEEPVEITVGEALKKGILKKTIFAYAFGLAAMALKVLGLPEQKIRFRQHLPEEKAHYANDAWDVEFKTEKFGWVEICGVHDRSDYDLRMHQKFSGKSFEVPVDSGKKIPEIMEIAFGIDRLIYSILENFFTYDEKLQRKLLKLPPWLSPVKAAVFPIVAKEDFQKKAMEIFFELRKNFKVVYDEKGSIGRRYRRQDEIGTPFCITVDGRTLEDGTVTVRFRDTAEQIRVKAEELVGFLEKRCKPTV